MQRYRLDGCQPKKRDMRKILALAFSVMLLTACKKSAPGGIVGTWELSEQIGGIAGVNNFPPGNGIMLQFRANGTYKEFNTRTPGTTTGTYHVTNSFLPDEEDILVRVIDGTSLMMTDSVHVTAEELLISVPPRCCDIPYATGYRRIY